MMQYYNQHSGKPHVLFSASRKASDATSVCVSSNGEIMFLPVLAGNALLRHTPMIYPTLGKNVDWHWAMWSLCVIFAFSVRFFGLVFFVCFVWGCVWYVLPVLFPAAFKRARRSRSRRDSYKWLQRW